MEFLHVALHVSILCSCCVKEHNPCFVLGGCVVSHVKLLFLDALNLAVHGLLIL
jgi:hypothetical protein